MVSLFDLITGARVSELSTVSLQGGGEELSSVYRGGALGSGIYLEILFELCHSFEVVVTVINPSATQAHQLALFLTMTL